MTTELATKTCVPCEKGTTSLQGEAIKELQQQLDAAWKVVNDQQLEREYQFKNFKEALAFTNMVGEIAEQEQHHPDIYLSWGKVKLQLCTHSIGGLSENDFVLASKLDAANGK